MKILIISSDPVGKQMAGLGIRNYQIAKTLSKRLTDVELTLAVPNIPDLEEKSFVIEQYKNNFSKFKLIAKNDLIISQGFGLAGIAFYFTKKKFLLDLYDPINLEWLETAKEEKERVYENRNKFNKDYLNIQLKLANFIVCANKTQLGMWLGMLFSLGRIKGKFYKEDPLLKKIIDIAAFSIRDQTREKKTPILKGVVKGIEKKDTVLIWNGGVWNWFDADIVVKAMAEISKQRKDVKLYFLGTKHPNPDVKEFRSLNSAYELSKKLGLLNKVVFFNFGWVDYKSSGTYLLDADIAITTYSNNLETFFSNRSRFLDAFWARLPLICTQGDYLSTLVEKETWGLTIPEKNESALVNAIKKLIDDKDFYELCKKNLEKADDYFSPEVSLAPIVAFCLNTDSYPLKRGFSYTFNLFVIYLRRLRMKLFKVY